MIVVVENDILYAYVLFYVYEVILISQFVVKKHWKLLLVQNCTGILPQICCFLEEFDVHLSTNSYIFFARLVNRVWWLLPMEVCLSSACLAKLKIINLFIFNLVIYL